MTHAQKKECIYLILNAEHKYQYKRNLIIYGSHPCFITISGNSGIKDPTADKADKLAKLDEEYLPLIAAEKQADYDFAEKHSENVLEIVKKSYEKGFDFGKCEYSRGYIYNLRGEYMRLLAECRGLE